MNNFNALTETLNTMLNESGYSQYINNSLPIKLPVDPAAMMSALGAPIGVFTMVDNAPMVMGSALITGAFSYRYDKNGNGIDAYRGMDALSRQCAMTTRNYRALTSYRDVANGENTTDQVQISPIVCTIAAPVGMTSNGIELPYPEDYIQWQFKHKTELTPDDFSLVVNLEPHVNNVSKEESTLRGVLRSAVLNGTNNPDGCGVVGNKLVVAPTGGLYNQLSANSMLGCVFIGIGNYIVGQQSESRYNIFRCSTLFLLPFMPGNTSKGRTRIIGSRQQEYTMQQATTALPSYQAAKPVPVVAKPTPPAEPTTSLVLPVSKEADAPSKVLPLPGAGQVKPETVEPTVDIDYDQYLS